MSDAYEEFAVSTYERVFSILEERLTTTEGPLLLVSFDQHVSLGAFGEEGLERDGLTGAGQLFVDFEMAGHMNTGIPLTGPSPLHEREPAVASAYTHIALLQAAIALVGPENVTFSLEMRPDDISRYREMISQPGAFFEAVKLPNYHPFTFAENKEIEMIAVDRLQGFEGVSEQDRNDAIHGDLRAIAGRDNPPRINIFITGTNHGLGLMGYDDETFVAEALQDGLTPDPANSPFLGSYSDVVFFNTPRLTPRFENLLVGILESSYLSRHEPGGLRVASEILVAQYLARHPENAFQFDPPGAMDYGDIGDVQLRIIQAYANHGTARLNDTLSAPASELKVPNP